MVRRERQVRRLSGFQATPRSTGVDKDNERLACLGTGSESCSEVRKGSVTRPVCGKGEQNEDEASTSIPPGSHGLDSWA